MSQCTLCPRRVSTRPHCPWRTYDEPVSDVLSCPGCGFIWDDVAVRDVPGRLERATSAFVDVLATAGELAPIRPELDRWSIVEYAAHLRDVHLTLRERVILATILDDAVGTPIFRDERVNAGFYASDTANTVAHELQVTSQLLLRAVATLSPEQLAREFTYSPASPMRVTVLWAAAQGVHESEHHLADARDNLARLAP